MLIPGENAMIFLDSGYGLVVLVGHVAQELPHGWIVDPCRELLETPDVDRLPELAAGDKELRRGSKFGPLIKHGFRAPFGVASIVWDGSLPKGGE